MDKILEESSETFIQLRDGSAAPPCLVLHCSNVNQEENEIFVTQTEFELMKVISLSKRSRLIHKMRIDWDCSVGYFFFTVLSSRLVLPNCNSKVSLVFKHRRVLSLKDPRTKEPGITWSIIVCRLWNASSEKWKLGLKHKNVRWFESGRFVFTHEHVHVSAVSHDGDMTSSRAFSSKVKKKLRDQGVEKKTTSPLVGEETR